MDGMIDSKPAPLDSPSKTLSGELQVTFRESAKNSPGGKYDKVKNEISAKFHFKELDKKATEWGVQPCRSGPKIPIWTRDIDP